LALREATGTGMSGTQEYITGRFPANNQYVGVDDDGRRKTTDGRQETILNIYPNPADDLMIVEFFGFNSL